MKGGPSFLFSYAGTPGTLLVLLFIYPGDSFVRRNYGPFVLVAGPMVTELEPITADEQDILISDAPSFDLPEPQVHAPQPQLPGMAPALDQATTAGELGGGAAAARLD
jgi:hypothetical protein